jgi:hypothetical protein
MPPPSQGMPPYTDIVFQPQTQDLVGIAGTGMLTFLIARAEPTGTGGWAVYGTVKTLAAAARMSTNTFAKAIESLEGAGLIIRQTGKRYGPGFGSDPNSYWLTYHPAMIGPTTPGDGTPGDGPFPGPNGSPGRGLRDRRNGDLTNRDVIGRDLIPRHLVPVPAHGSAVDTSTSEMSAGDVVDACSSSPTQQQQHPGRDSRTELPAPTALARAPRFVADALRAVGWTAEVPAGVPLNVLAAVATDLAHRTALDLPGAKSNPAGFLHYLITRGDIVGYAADNRLLANDPTGQLDAHGASVDVDGLMTMEQFEQLAVHHGVWAHAVRVEAGRLARTSGAITADGKVPQRLLREVATRTPLADEVPARLTADNPF